MTATTYDALAANAAMATPATSAMTISRLLQHLHGRASNKRFVELAGPPSLINGLLSAVAPPKNQLEEFPKKPNLKNFQRTQLEEFKVSNFTRLPTAPYEGPVLVDMRGA